MSQYLRPSADINTGWAKSTGSYRYTCIDEETYNDADYIRGSSDSYQECRLSTPASTPASGTCTLRYRAKRSSLSNLTSFAMEVRQGSTVITSLTTLPSLSMGDYHTSFSASSVTDWSDVRVRFTIDLSGICTVDVSWVELEIPDPPIAAGLEMGMMF